MKQFTPDELYEEAKKLIETGVIMSGNGIIQNLLRYAEDGYPDAIICPDDFYGKPVCPDCKSTNYDEYEPDEELKDADDTDEYEYVCEDCGFRFNEPDYPEILEYWFVDDWLANELARRGEQIFEVQGHYPVWGRQTSGQSIALDGVIQDIAKERLEKENN